jgi:hypothetical protein
MRKIDRRRLTFLLSSGMTIPGDEERRVTARNCNSQGFALARSLKVLIETLAKLSSIVANNIVFACLVPRASAKDEHTNIMLSQFLCNSKKRPLADEDQKLRKKRRLCKVRTFDDAQNERPSRIVIE